MASYIQGLTDQSGNNVYPLTKADAVYFNDNVPLSEREVRLDGFEITTDIFQINDSSIKSTSLIDVYYADPNYKIQPTYEQRDGSFIITLPEVPDEAILVSAIVIKNI